MNWPDEYTLIQMEERFILLDDLIEQADAVLAARQGRMKGRPEGDDLAYLRDRILQVFEQVWKAQGELHQLIREKAPCRARGAA